MVHGNRAGMAIMKPSRAHPGVRRTRVPPAALLPNGRLRQLRPARKLREIVGSRDYYDALAAGYDAELRRKAAYVVGVDKLVIEWAGRIGASTLLDVGCGNGARLKRIAAAAGLTGVGIDDSAAMVEQALQQGVDAYVTDIASTRPRLALGGHRQFDLVIALWNVLGHIEGAGRHQALVNMRALVAKNGLVIVDVNNRHNARHYGWLRAGRNLIADWLRRGTGDFVVARSVSGREIATVSHVFSEAELKALLEAARLNLVATYYVDYNTGDLQPKRWGGQLCAVASPA